VPVGRQPVLRRLLIGLLAKRRRELPEASDVIVVRVAQDHDVRAKVRCSFAEQGVVMAYVDDDPCVVRIDQPALSRALTVSKDRPFFT
jgi:hypothetical protein